MKKSLPLFLLVLLPSFLFCETLWIRNNTTNDLNATLYEKESIVFSVILKERQTYGWQDNPHGAGNNKTGPFSIIFTCKSGKTWGTIRNANWGFTYNATSAVGPKHCK